MTAEQFTYWLQGYAEINGAPPTVEQWQVIRDHLRLVFDKRTPDSGGPIPYAPTPFGNPPWGTPNAIDGGQRPRSLQAECKTVIC